MLIPLRHILSFAAVLLLLWPAAALHAQDFPALTGRVVDQADLLTPVQELSITQRLEALEQQSKRQLVVATISDLDGYDIADYGYRLGRNWGIGDKDRNDGALLIIAPNERQMRIEVGYGLEAYLTDALSSKIIRDDITPKFKAGDFPGGINAGVDSIAAQLKLSPEEAAKIARDAESKRNDDGGGSSISFWIFIFIFVIWPAISSFRNRGKKHRGKGVTILPAPSLWGMGSRGRSGGFSGGFSGGGGSFGGGGASGGW